MPPKFTVVSVLPQCSFCDEVAHYDFRTKPSERYKILIRWAYGCEEHWRQWRADEGLGIGEGQLLIREKDIRSIASKLISKQQDSILNECEVKNGE